MRSRVVGILLGLGLILGLTALHLVTAQPSEPFFNTDEPRHLMTGVFFRDLLADGALVHPARYAVNYFLQYPALGLLLWPPFFHALEGGVMLVLGTEVVVARILVGLLGALGCAYLYALVSRTHDRTTAALAVLLFALSPLVFTLSRYVMLEVPTVAFGLMATYHGLRFLQVERRWDLGLAAAATAAALLTRFDAIYLLVFLAGSILVTRRFRLLGRTDVWAAALLVVLVVLPVYGVIARELGWFRAAQVAQRIPGGSRPLGLDALLFYPRAVADQVGWPTFLAALVGLLGSLAPARARRNWPYLTLAAAAYLTLTLLPNLRPRYSIYMIPAVAALAADGCLTLAAFIPWRWFQFLPPVLVVAGAAGLTISKPVRYVRGYENTVGWVVAEAGPSGTVLFDGELTGNFVYQVRQRDPARRLGVLRADKLLYSEVAPKGDPSHRYVEYVGSDEDILALMYRYDPALIVVEEPGMDLPMAHRLRAVLRAHPDRFRLERVFTVESNVPYVQARRLLVYRNLARNPNPDRDIEFEMLWLRRRIEKSGP